MKKSILISTFLLLFISLNVFSQPKEIYSRVKVYGTEAQFVKLLQRGVSLEELAERNKKYLVGDFSAAEIKIMKEENLRVDFLINDLAADFTKRNIAAFREAQVAAAAATVPQGFNYGSMGGYYTFAEMERELDSLKLMYPGLITTKVSIGNSLEGRPIWMIKISDNANVDENEPEVFLNGLIHAREPISMTNLIYFMQYILANYNTDPELNCLINNREIYLVPCINPDGYVYNQTTNPSGGGLWRKNRKNNGDGTFGVDINRNFGYNWGYDDLGSSPVGSSESYRGTSAFSEPETQIIRDFCIAHQFGNTANHHSYANTFNTPWGYVNLATPDNTHYLNWGAIATVENGLQVGTSYQNLGYTVNGGANDWMYGEQTTKNKIFAAVVETGSSSDGFWPVQSRIIPLNESNLRLNIATCWAAGDYFQAIIPSGTSGGGSNYALPVRVTNYGLLTGVSGETVSFITTDARVTGIGAPVSLLNLSFDGILNSSIALTFAANATPGTISGTLRIATRNGCNLDFPASFNFTGNCSALPSGWTSGDVGAVGINGSVCYIPSTYTVSGSGTGLTGSSDQYQLVKAPTSGNYTIIARVSSVQNTASGAKAGIVITESTAVGAKRVSICLIPSTGKIEFQSRKTTGAKVTTTATASGTAPRWLKITRNGSTFSAYYSSNGTTWTLYKTASITMNNAAYAGLAVTSGVNTTLNTSVFDNVSVTAGVLARFDPSSDVSVLGENNKIAVYPNPVNGSNTKIQFNAASAATAQLKVTDMLGRVVLNRTISINEGLNSVQLDGLDNLKPGMYIIGVKNEVIDIKTKLTINR